MIYMLAESAVRKMKWIHSSNPDILSKCAYIQPHFSEIVCCICATYNARREAKMKMALTALSVQSGKWR